MAREWRLNSAFALFAQTPTSSPSRYHGGTLFSSHARPHATLAATPRCTPWRLAQHQTQTQRSALTDSNVIESTYRLHLHPRQGHRGCSIRFFQRLVASFSRSPSATRTPSTKPHRAPCSQYSLLQRTSETSSSSQLVEPRSRLSRLSVSLGGYQQLAPQQLSLSLYSSSSRRSTLPGQLLCPFRQPHT